jgi:hypothetical protein
MRPRSGAIAQSPCRHCAVGVRYAGAGVLSQEADMPDYAPRSTTTTTPDGAAAGHDRHQPDLQGRLGNAAIVELLRDQQQAGGAQDPDSLWDIASQFGASTAPDLRDGAQYTVAAGDMQYSEGATWKHIARQHGMHEDLLMAFNEHVGTVDQGGGQDNPLASTPKLAEGVRIYIPSADEIVFKQVSERKGGDVAAATAEYNELAGGHNLAMMRTARERASGTVGLGYGTKGDDAVFYSQNPALAGASQRAGRSVMINGEKEYKVAWGASFWKCSVFLHDTTYSAGFEPDMTENKHYQLAGQLHWSRDYTEVDVKHARPGDAWQRFGGTRSDESHNAILSSYVDVDSSGAEYDDWTFSIVGAESERAAESERNHTMLKGTNENTAGKKIRFFRPKQRRGA